VVEWSSEEDEVKGSQEDQDDEICAAGETSEVLVVGRTCTTPEEDRANSRVGVDTMDTMSCKVS
jgi:hypothetical protein